MKLHKLVFADRDEKKTIEGDGFQGAASETKDLRHKRRIRELLEKIEQLSWRTYLDGKSRDNR